MLSLDNRAGNVVTTVAVFVIVATILYLARGAFLILLLSILFALLLEPAVTWVQRHSPLGRKNRALAIAQVCVIGTLMLGTLGFEFGSRLAAQIKNLNADLPQILEDLSSGKVVPEKAGRHGLSAAQQRGIQDLLARNHDFVRQVFERGAASIAYIAASAIWLFAVPILAVFILLDGRQMVDAIIQAGERRGDLTVLKQLLQRIDTMLAKYIRAQLALAGLSFGFYSLSTLILRFPYAIALGGLGGVLEFLPTVGWIASAVAILTVGFLTHSHWIWMAGLLVAWRLALDYVISPRIMGSNLQLQPLTVLFALMAGGQVAGIAGVYLAVPTVAMLRIVWLECLSAHEPCTALASQPLARVKDLKELR
jgi:predicted PurR-regulated permease PerM